MRISALISNFEFREPLAKLLEKFFEKGKDIVMSPKSDRMMFPNNHDLRQRKDHHVLISGEAITVLAEHTRNAVCVVGGGSRGT